MAFEITPFISPAIKLVGWIVGRFKKPAPASVLKHRLDLRNDFQQNLPAPNNLGIRGEAIIRDLDRMDSYPNVDLRRQGISPWFEVEIKGLYERGLEVFIAMPRRIRKDMYGEWKISDPGDEEGILAYQVARIPSDVIEYVDWDGDAYHRTPHIYCHYKFKGGPYEEIVFFGKFTDSEDLYEVTDFRPGDKKGWLDWLKRSDH